MKINNLRRKLLKRRKPNNKRHLLIRLKETRMIKTIKNRLRNRKVVNNKMIIQCRMMMIQTLKSTLLSHKLLIKLKDLIKGKLVQMPIKINSKNRKWISNRSNKFEKKIKNKKFN